MYTLDWLPSRRYRRIWRDPLRRRLTLASFAETEEDGGNDLAAAADRVVDPDLRRHLRHHALDELRHARLFRERAARVAEEHPPGPGLEESSRAYDLAGARASGDEVNAHGFFPAVFYDALGEVDYIAMLFVAEGRAATLFRRHEAAARAAGDGETAELLRTILRDERNHVAWTGRTLELWRRAGRGAEVQRALSGARRGRFLGAWRRLGQRATARLARVLLLLLYWTALAPFGLAARASRPAQATWRAPRASERLTSQY